MNRLCPPMATIRWAFKYGSWNPTKDEWLRAIQSVQEEEKNRVGRFVFQRDSKSALSGRLLLRKAIAHNLGVPYADIRLERTDKGKPYLANPGYPPLSFNVSHQGDYAILAADSVHNVGTDVMKIEYPMGSKTIEEFFGHMSRQFTVQEWQTIKSFDSEWDQLAAFYRNWCLKESYVKALGIGIGFSLQRIDFHTSSAVSRGALTLDTVVLVDGELCEDWLFQECMLDDRHCAAVALQKGGSPFPPEQMPLFTELSMSQLLEGAQPLTRPDPDHWADFSAKQARPGLAK